MNKTIPLLLLLAFLLAGCNSNTSTPETKKPGRLPKFEAVDSDGRRLVTEQFRDRVLIAVFFDQNSGLAWRTLSELGRKHANDGVFVLGFANSEVASDNPVNINTLKQEYQISFPIIPDRDKRFSEAFDSPTCCDYLTVYDKQGALKSSMKLSESYDKMDSMMVDASDANPALEHPFALKANEVLEGIKITRPVGPAQQLPIASHGLTIVNLFADFCTECLTGNRLQTIERLNQAGNPKTNTIMVFSKEHFSTADLENFKAMLPIPGSLVQGDITMAQPYLNQGMLLMVFDESKKLIWQEQTGMSEQRVLAEVSRLIQTSAKTGKATPVISDPATAQNGEGR